MGEAESVVWMGHEVQRGLRGVGEAVECGMGEAKCVVWVRRSVWYAGLKKAWTGAGWGGVCGTCESEMKSRPMPVSIIRCLEMSAKAGRTWGARMWEARFTMWARRYLRYGGGWGAVFKVWGSATAGRTCGGHQRWLARLDRQDTGASTWASGAP